MAQVTLDPFVLGLAKQEGFLKTDLLMYFNDCVSIGKKAGLDPSQMVINFDKGDKLLGRVCEWRRKRYLKTFVPLGIKSPSAAKLREIEECTKKDEFSAFCFSFEVDAREQAVKYFKELPNLFNPDAPMDESDPLGMCHRSTVWMEAWTRLVSKLNQLGEKKTYLTMTWTLEDWRTIVRSYMAAADARFREMDEFARLEFMIDALPKMMA